MKQLSLTEKQGIQEQLRVYVTKYPSQNKAVNSLNGISTGTVSTILNGKFDTISDDMFRRMQAQIAPTLPSEWKLCETTAFRELTTLLTDAQENQNVSWVVGNAGIGKTTAAREYASAHENAFVISCSEDMRRGDFIREMARVIGIKISQQSLREKMQMVTNELQLIDRPLLIFDEGDKLMDSVFYYFISIYNALEGHCGIIFLSTEYIKRRMEIGISYNKKGYDEIFSRVCRRFIDLTPASAYEVSAVCRANGLNNEGAIAEVLKDAKEQISSGKPAWGERKVQPYLFDLRRVRKSIHKSKKLAAVEQ